MKVLKEKISPCLHNGNIQVYDRVDLSMSVNVSLCVCTINHI